MAKDYRPIGYGAPRAARAPLVGSRAPCGYGWGRLGGGPWNGPKTGGLSWGPLLAQFWLAILALRAVTGW